MENLHIIEGQSAPFPSPEIVVSGCASGLSCPCHGRFGSRKEDRRTLLEGRSGCSLWLWPMALRGSCSCHSCGQ